MKTLNEFLQLNEKPAFFKFLPDEIDVIKLFAKKNRLEFKRQKKGFSLNNSQISKDSSVEFVDIVKRDVNGRGIYSTSSVISKDGSDKIGDKNNFKSEPFDLSDIKSLNIILKRLKF